MKKIVLTFIILLVSTVSLAEDKNTASTATVSAQVINPIILNDYLTKQNVPLSTNKIITYESNTKKVIINFE